jgi:hypothetical protein
MTNDLLPPDELFRHYQRGMLDEHTLHTQILLHLIELVRTQQAIKEMMDFDFVELSGVALDVRAIATLLGMVRPSTQTPRQARPGRGTTGEAGGLNVD